MAREDGYSNLVPFNERSEDEVRTLGQKGGVASGTSRRRKRSLKEAADLYLSLPVSDRRAWNRISKKGIDPEDVDNQMAMIIGLTDKAIKGDARAAKVIIDLLAEHAEDSNADGSMSDLIKGLKEE